MTSGIVACWGGNDFPQAFPPPGTFTAISADGFVSNSQTCGVKTTGSLACWGYGQAPATPPTGAFSAISAGAGHACGVRTNGRVACWGANDFGQATVPPGFR